MDATVQMLRLLAMPTRDIQQAFLAGRELCVQNHLKAARITAHATAQHARGVHDAAEAAAQWHSVDTFLNALGEELFPRLRNVRHATPWAPALCVLCCNGSCCLRGHLLRARECRAACKHPWRSCMSFVHS